jgi:hypothetical protein
MLSATTTSDSANAQPLAVSLGGITYPADVVARGAAFEVFASTPADGFAPNPRPGTLLPYRRFVHVSEVDVVAGEPAEATDPPLRVPLHRSMSWSTVFRASQVGGAPGPGLTAVRETARVRRGTRMLKVLSGRQLSGMLRGLLPRGFCHREYDVAHLRTPNDLGVLSTDGALDERVVFAMRWRAASPDDYQVPYAWDYPGLTRISPHERLGGPVLGTGFAPSRQHIIPEFVTADLADVPLPVHTELIAFTADGTEVLLYRYLGEQRAWGRLAGRQWRHLLDQVPDIAADQEYFPVPPAATRIVGTHRGSEYEGIADPPDDVWVLAKVRALRHALDAPERRTPAARWRDVPCTVVRDSESWARVRLIRPEPGSIGTLGATCAERGVYEAWAPAGEITHRAELRVPL